MQKEKFIKLVKKHPILYDCTHEDFKNSCIKYKIWNEIGRQLNESGDELKKKWKSLRDCYAKYIKRTLRQKRPKKWVWAEQMSFFRPFLNIHKTQAKTVYDQQQSSDSDDQLLEGMAPSVADDDEYVISQSEYVGHDSQQEDSVFYVPDSPTTSSFPDNSLKPQTTLSITETRSLKRKHEGDVTNSTPEHNNGQHVKDDFDDVECLLLAHAKTIKKFCAKRQAVTKHKIAQIILEQEMLHIQETSREGKGT